MYFRSDDDVRACDDVRTELMPFIQSQYAASVRITALLQSAKNHILPDADIAQFYDLMFNVETAQGYGLDVWGTIVGITRTVQDVTINEQGVITPLSTTRTLGDEEYRKLIMVKAASNIMDSSLYSINYILKQLYPDKICYVTPVTNWQTIEVGGESFTYNSEPMAISYVFINTELTPDELGVFYVVGNLNRGAGVDWNLLVVDQDKIFGFVNSNLQPFDQGLFVMQIGG